MRLYVHVSRVLKTCEAVSCRGSKYLPLCDFLYTEKPVERMASVETDRPQPAAATAKPLPPEDLFGSVPFVASAGKS